MLAGAHGKRQLRDLYRAGIDFHARKVFSKNELGNLALTITALLVHMEEQLKRIDQDMARAACGVAEGYLLGTRNADEVLVLSIGLDVILHALAQRTPWIVEHPQTAERVLDHIAHDPLGGEELRGGRDVRRRCLALGLEELVFNVGIVVLIHPAQNGHALAPVLVSENGIEFAHHTVSHHEALGQQQLHGSAHAFKDARQAIGKLLALSNKQVAPQRFIQARHLELGYAIGIGRRYFHVQCVLHGLAAMAAVRTT